MNKTFTILTCFLALSFTVQKAYSSPQKADLNPPVVSGCESNFTNYFSKNGLLMWYKNDKETYFYRKCLGKTQEGYYYVQDFFKGSQSKLTGPYLIKNQNDITSWEAKSREGLISIWFENAQKQWEGYYKNGKKEGIWLGWNNDGSKWSESYYVNGKNEGTTALWHKNGQKYIETHYKNGEEHGLSISWHTNGKKRSQVRMKNGREDGSYMEWDDKGKRRYNEH